MGSILRGCRIEYALQAAGVALGDEVTCGNKVDCKSTYQRNDRALRF